MNSISEIMRDYINKQDTIIFIPNITIEEHSQTILFKLDNNFYIDYPIVSDFNLNNNLNSRIHKDTLLFDTTNFRELLGELNTHVAYDTTINLVKHLYRTTFNLISSNITDLNIKKLNNIPSLTLLKNKIDSITTIIIQLDTLLTKIEDYINNGS